MAGFGVSFVPSGLGGPSREDQAAGRPSGLSPAQSAIQLLSLRLPRVAGAQALAPGPLLNSPGGMGGPGGGLQGAMANPLLQALLRLAGLSEPLMGGPSAPMPPGLGGPSGAPAPLAQPGLGPTPPRFVPGTVGPRLPGPGAPTFPSGLPDAPTQEWWKGPVDARPGPGTTTFPPIPADAPTYDRTQSGVGNRAGGPRYRY